MENFFLNEESIFFGQAFFEKRSSNTGAGAGYIHESSPTKGGQNSFTQGKTYTFYIIN